MFILKIDKKNCCCEFSCLTLKLMHFIIEQNREMNYLKQIFTKIYFSVLHMKINC